MKSRRRSMVIVLFGLICLLSGISFLPAEDKSADTGKQKYLETVLFQQDFEQYPVGDKKIENVYGYPEDAPPDFEITDKTHSTSKRALKVTLHPELKKDHVLSLSTRPSITPGALINIFLRVKLVDIAGGQAWQTPLIRAYFYDKNNAEAGYADLLYSVAKTESKSSDDDNWIMLNQEVTPKENWASVIMKMFIYDGQGVGGAVYLDDIKITQKTPRDTSLIWQIGGSFLPFNTYDLADNPVIKASPNFDVKTHTFTYRLPDEGGLVTNVIPKGIGAIGSTYYFSNEIPTTIILKWKEEEAGLRRLEMESGFYRKMLYERGDLRAEFPNGQVKYWDFAKSYYDQNKAAWQNVGPLTISAVFEVKPGENFVKFDLQSARRGDNVLFNTIKLVEAKEKEPLLPVLEFSTGKLGNVFDVSDKAALSANIYNCAPGQKSNFSYTVKDYFNQTVTEGTVNFTADSFGKAESEVTPKIEGTGYFLLTPTIAGKEAYAFDFVRVVKADEKEKVDYDKSHFGANLFQCEYGLKNPEMYEKIVILARQAGVTWTRFNNISWRWMEGGRDFTAETADTSDRPDIVGPEKRWYNWEPWDDQINISHKHGLNILATFLTTPDWAKKYPGKDFSHMGWHDVPIPAEYADFVGKTVSRYKDKIKYWEIWNEAYFQGQSSYWGGSPEDYGDIQKAGYPVIKKIDPEAKVLCTSSTGDLFQEKFIVRAGLDTFDINNEHYRVGYKVCKDLFEWWKDRGINKPAWSTEVFSFIQPLFAFENSDKKAAGMWKIIITDWAAGMEKTFYWFAEVDCLNDVDLHATVFYPVFRTLTHRLEGAEYINHNFSLGEGVEAYIFKNNGEMFTVIWAGGIQDSGEDQEPKEVSFNVGVPRVKIIDIMDNEREALTENGVLRIKAGYVPCIIKGGNPEAILLPTALHIGPENTFIMVGETNNYEMRLKNIYQTALKGDLSFEEIPPDWKIAPEKKNFVLQGLEELVVPVKITPAADAGHNIYDLKVNAKLEDRKGTILTAPLKVGTVDTPFGANLFPNPGFEEGEDNPPTGWVYGQLNPDVKFNRVTEEAHSGKYSVKFQAAQKRSGSLFVPSPGTQISVLPGEVYILSNWCKGDPAMRCSLHMRQYDQGGKYVTTDSQSFFYQPAAEGWKRTVNVFVVPEGIFSINLAFVFQDIQGTIYLDDFSFSRFRGKPIMNKFLYELRSPKASAPLTIDGDGQKWQKIEKAFLNDISSVRKSGETESTTGDIPFDWRGKDDLSVEFATQWDEKNLYLWVKVKDDVFSQTFTGFERYKGDSIQIALDPNNAANPNISEYSELMFSTNPEGKTEVYQSTALPNPLLLAAMRIGLMNDWKVVVKRDEAKKETSYEAAIPFLVFGPGFKPKPGEAIGFSLLVNDNDGQGRRGWMEWSSGIGKDKQPRLYGSVTFKDFLTKETGELVKTPAKEADESAKTLIDESDLLVIEPKEYEVFQRSTKQQGYIRVSGKTRLEGDTVEFRISGKSLPGSVPEKWQQIPFDSVTKSFKGMFPITPGGWYRVDIRVLKNTKEIAGKTIENVGVGEVFIGAGQSNSTNCGDEKLVPNTGMVATFSGTDWRLADDPQPGVQDETTGGSPWPAFGDAMFEKYGVPIGIAATGCGGTSVSQWDPNYKLFNGLVTRISQLGRSGFRAVLWHQGESDVLQGTPSQDYFDAVSGIIMESQEKAGWKFPWFVAHAAYCCNSSLSLSPIRDAQEKLWQTKIALEGPDTDLLLGDNRNAGGYGIHLSGKGLRAHGKMWAEKVAKYLDELP